MKWRSSSSSTLRIHAAVAFFEAALISLKWRFTVLAVTERWLIPLLIREKLTTVAGKHAPFNITYLTDLCCYMWLKCYVKCFFSDSISLNKIVFHFSLQNLPKTAKLYSYINNVTVCVTFSSSTTPQAWQGKYALWIHSRIPSSVIYSSYCILITVLMMGLTKSGPWQVTLFSRQYSTLSVKNSHI